VAALGVEAALLGAQSAARDLRAAMLAELPPTDLDQRLTVLRRMAEADAADRQGLPLAEAELAPLRALLRSALADWPLAPPPEAATQRLLALEAGLAAQLAENTRRLAREAQAVAETGFLPDLLRVLLLSVAVLLSGLGLLIYDRSRRLRAAHAELALWVTDASRVIAAIPGLAMRARRRPGPRGLDILFVGEAVRPLTGDTPAQARAPGWLERRVDGEDLPELFTAFDRALAGAEPVATIRFHRADGRLAWLRVAARRHVAPDGSTEILSLWADVTRERELADRLARSTRLAQLGEVATAMAHELNQPLAGIHLAAENAQRLLERSPDAAPRLRQKLDTILELAQRAAGLIDRMRVFGRGAEAPLQPVELPALLDRLAERLAPRLAATSARPAITLSRRLPDALPPALARPLPLEQALANLLAHAADAFDAMPAPPARPLLLVTAQAMPGAIRLSLADNAGSITDEEAQRLFEPFFATRGIPQPAALGLAAAYGILHDAQASLAARPAPEGLVIEVTLPAAC
jgi:signal transduction histidine kinase